VSNQLQKFSVYKKIPEYNFTGGGKLVLQSLSTITDEDCLEKVSNRSCCINSRHSGHNVSCIGVGKMLNIAKNCPWSRGVQEIFQFERLRQ